jgi:hypothetical protein
MYKTKQISPQLLSQQANYTDRRKPLGGEDSEKFWG